MIPRYWRVSAATLGIGGSVAVGVTVARSPLVAAGAVVGLSAITFGVIFARRLPRVFLAAVGVLMVGYAVFGRSFAYLGVPPIFLGELTLALGLLTALVSGGVLRALWTPLTWLLLMWAGWCASRTLPYVGTYRLDALRDAVVWGYSLFAILVAAYLPRSGWLMRIPDWYWRFLPWFVLWVPIGWGIYTVAFDKMPVIPGTTDVTLINFKSGDAAVHLAGVATFLVLGLHQMGRWPHRGGGRVFEWFLWTIWLVGFMLVAATNRGGALASLAAIFVVALLRPGAARRKFPIVAMLAITLLLGASVVNNTSMSLEYKSRDASPDQVITNLKSIVVGGGGESLEGSRQWRLAWWNRIMDYTVHGDLFWTGKGFGVNLADDDGFQVTADHSLRSPHSAHLMLLARTGVPGLALWVLLQGAFALTLLSAYVRARRTGQEWWARVDLWVLAYWVAFQTNASFDVFLEGPQGGIWFWCLFGFGIAILEMQRAEVPGPVAYAVIQGRA